MIDLDSLKWWGLVAHRVFTGLGVAWLSLDRLWERFWKVEEFIDRRTHERRHTVNILKVPAVIEDGHQLAEDILAAKALIAPTLPQLIADAEKFKTDTEELLGLNATPAALPIEPPKVG